MSMSASPGMLAPQPSSFNSPQKQSPAQEGMSNLMERINEYGAIIAAGEMGDQIMNPTDKSSAPSSELEVFLNGGGSGA